MKNNVTVGILCLLIGIAIGWVAKPKTDPDLANNSDPNTTSSRKPVSSPRPGSDNAASPDTKSDRSRIIGHKVAVGGTGNHEMSDEDMKRFEEAQKHLANQILERQRGKFENQITDLVAALGLDASQEAALRAFYEKNIKRFQELVDDNGMHDPSKMKELANILRGGGLDDELANILNDDQTEAYEQMKADERSRKMDTAALRELSKLTGVLDLSADQKEAVYDVLYEKAGVKLDNPSDASLIMQLSMENTGFTIDMEDTGIGQIVDLQMDSSDGGELDQDKMVEALRDQSRRRIDDKVNSISEHLTEKQQQRYREHLESKSQGLFNTLLYQGQGGTLTTESEAIIISPSSEE